MNLSNIFDDKIEPIEENKEVKEASEEVKKSDFFLIVHETD